MRCVSAPVPELDPHSARRRRQRLAAEHPWLAGEEAKRIELQLSGRGLLDAEVQALAAALGGNNLKAEAGRVMGMVLHELATNAAKHGALSAQNGRVSIRWQQRLSGHPRPSLVLDWREVGGPCVVVPPKLRFCDEYSSRPNSI
jgi:two-component sensor histidine kinase